MNLSDLPDLPEGETEETCLEHIKALQKEMDKVTNKNQALIRELMDTTFSFRREKMFEESERIEEVLHKYPALQLVSEVCKIYRTFFFPRIYFGTANPKQINISNGRLNTCNHRSS